MNANNIFTVHMQCLLDDYCIALHYTVQVFLLLGSIPVLVYSVATV